MATSNGKNTQRISEKKHICNILVYVKLYTRTESTTYICSNLLSKLQIQKKS